MQREAGLTSQNNSLPRRPQNQDIQDTSSELLMVLQTTTQLHRELLHIKKKCKVNSEYSSNLFKNFEQNHFPLKHFIALFEFSASSRICDS